MINNRPFIHVLKTPYSYYVYDVNTDRVVRISDEMYNYFLDIEHGIESKMSHELSVEMNELSISGYLKTFHPKEIQDPREFQLEYLLNNRIEGLTLQITQKCNMRCSYCSFTCGDNIHGRSHSSNSMSYETAISAIDFYYQHSMDSKLINIAFYGGEPLLEFEKIKRIIEYVKIKFEGKDITRLKQSQLKEVYGDIQMVFQNPVGSFDPRRTLGDGIGESLRNRGMKKADVEKRVAELLEQCGLEKEYAKRYPHEVSGGQCQRAAIARALAVKPKVLICDEATSALDVTIQKQIMELLEDLKEKKGLSFIFICHNLALVQMFCDRVLVLYEGKVVESGIPDDIINEPKEEYTQRLVDAVLS